MAYKVTTFTKYIVTLTLVRIVLLHDKFFVPYSVFQLEIIVHFWIYLEHLFFKLLQIPCALFPEIGCAIFLRTPCSETLISPDPQALLLLSSMLAYGP